MNKYEKTPLVELTMELSELQKDVFVLVTKHNEIIQEIYRRFPIQSVYEELRPMIIQMPIMEKEKTKER